MITVDVADRVMTVVLDRPDKLNALTSDGIHELVDALDRADADDAVRVVVITGRGRAFCAGADLSSGADSFTVDFVDSAVGSADGKGEVWRDGGGILTLRIFASWKPVIGAINGPAVGGSASMTLAMDVRLARRRRCTPFRLCGGGSSPRAVRAGSCPASSGSPPRRNGS